MTLCTIIPGPKKPIDLDSFLQPVKQEISLLEAKGIMVKVSDSLSFMTRATLAVTIGDIPGVADLCHHVGHYCLLRL